MPTTMLGDRTHFRARAAFFAMRERPALVLPAFAIFAAFVFDMPEPRIDS